MLQESMRLQREAIKNLCMWLVRVNQQAPGSGEVTKPGTKLQKLISGQHRCHFCNEEKEEEKTESKCI